MADDWNNIIANQTTQTLFLKNADDEEVRRKYHATVDSMIGIAPKDEVEGMIAAQLIACHNASMECYRRAMLPDISFDMRHGNLNSANKLSRTYAALVESLNRHRARDSRR